MPLSRSHGLVTIRWQGWQIKRSYVTGEVSITVNIIAGQEVLSEHSRQESSGLVWGETGHSPKRPPSPGQRGVYELADEVEKVIWEPVLF